MSRLNINWKGFDLNMIQILKWTCIGLLIRFILMPFTMHTMDIIYINYLPHKLITAGVWDPYSFVKTNLSYPFTYYPPLTHFIIAVLQLLLKPFTSNSINGFYNAAVQLINQGGYNVHFASTLQNYQLFRNLFILKLPYLFFDFGIGFLLLKLISEKKHSLFSYKLWMLNPVVLHSCYAVGQFEIIPTFFLMLAVYLIIKRKNYYLALISLVIGGAMKIIPFSLIPLTIIFGGRNIRQRVNLSILALGLLLSVYLPLYITSDGEVLRSLFVGTRETVSDYMSSFGKLELKFLFLNGSLFIGYLFMLYNAAIFSKAEKKEKYIIPIYTISILLLFAFRPISFKFLVWLTPLLLFYIPKNRIVRILTNILIVSLAIISLYGNQLQWSLFSPLYPTFFSSLPPLESFAGITFSLAFIHKAFYRIFIICCLILAYELWRKQLKMKKANV